MKKGNFGTNGSDLDKNNFIKPTLDTLMQDGRKALESYHANLDELFYSCYEVMQQRVILKDTAPIIIHKAKVAPEVQPNPSLSLDDVESMINSALERQAKSSDELVRRLIEERHGKKLANSDVNPSSSSFAVNFTQINLQTSGPSVGGTTMPIPSAQPMNHFYSRTTINGSTPTFGIPQQTMASKFMQGYTQVATIFSIPNFSLAPYTPGGNGRTYANVNSNYQALYSTVAYTDPIPLPSSSVGFLSNHAYHNTMWFNAYGQTEADDFGYETPPQFPLRLQPIDMTPARATAKPCTDPNNLTNQLATILRESFGIEPKYRGRVYQKPYPDYYDQLPYPRGYGVP
jgi:hypothetical protein